jgi:signal transduction histidine kinase
MTPRSPTPLQLVGLVVTVATLAAFSWYVFAQTQHLRGLQTGIIDRNRRDSLQLLRIQNNLTQLGLALRDMVDGSEPYPLAAWRSELRRTRTDLEDALTREALLAPALRTPEQQQQLLGAMERFWADADAMLALAEAGREADARRAIRDSLEGQRASIAGTAARLLVENNAAEAEAVRRIEAIYTGVERNLFFFLAAALAAVSITGVLVARANRRYFDALARLSEQRRELAGRLIDVQEDVFRSLAREIHDEFGQVLTAMGMMLGRAEGRLEPGSGETGAQIREVREIAQRTLERARTMSQMLHPPVLDDYGLEKSIEWYLAQFERQSGLSVHYQKSGASPLISEHVAIHVYRILQEALNNVLRHAGVEEVWVRAAYQPDGLRLEIEDRGTGMPAQPQTRGFGVIAMRERAGLLGGAVSFLRPQPGGTLVCLQVPFERTQPT